MNITVSFEHTLQNLAEIEILMENENKRPVKYQSNWIAVQSSFNRGELVIAQINNKIVGFFALLKSTESATIMVAQVQATFQNKGIGKTILKAIIKKSREENIHQLDLICEPRKSENAWREMGFVTMPKSELDNGTSIKLYMAL